MIGLPNRPAAVHVAAVALVDPEGRVLMQQRRAEAVHGGLWEFPGGKIEAHETAEAAAIREIVEELGVLLIPEHLDFVTTASGLMEGDSAARMLHIQLFAVWNWAGEPHAHAADQIAWYKPDRLGSLSMPPLDYPLAAALLQALEEKEKNPQ